MEQCGVTMWPLSHDHQAWRIDGCMKAVEKMKEKKKRRKGVDAQSIPQSEHSMPPTPTQQNFNEGPLEYE